MPPLRDLTGLRFGFLTVLNRGRNKGRVKIKTHWVCLCDCGRLCEVSSQNLCQSNTKSCGCKTRELISNLVATHGKSRSTEYKIWAGAKDRCFNKKNPRYADYGGRGISMCNEWKDDFLCFLSDMGPRPSSIHSLDRYPDPNGNYEPANSRWATPKQQSINRRISIWVEYKHINMPLRDWGIVWGKSNGALFKHFNKNQIKKMFDFYSQSVNMVQSIENLTSGVLFHYRGVPIEKVEIGFSVFDNIYSGLKEVDSEIDRRLAMLNNSLNRIKPSMQIVK